MANAKRPRGRPKGTEKDDSGVLMRLAEMLTTNPNLRVTTAFKKIVHRPDPAYIRRIQVKWRAVGAKLLDEVQARMAATPALRTRSQRLSSVELMRLAAESPTLLALQAFGDNPTFRAMRAFNDSQEGHALRTFHASPAYQKMVEIQSSPTVQKMLELQSSPAFQKMIELQSSPAFQKMLELQNSPAMRLMRERHEALTRLGF